MDNVLRIPALFETLTGALDAVEDKLCDVLFGTDLGINFEDISKIMLVDVPNNFQTLAEGLAEFVDKVGPILGVFDVLSQINIDIPPLPFA